MDVVGRPKLSVDIDVLHCPRVVLQEIVSSVNMIEIILYFIVQLLSSYNGYVIIIR